MSAVQRIDRLGLRLPAPPQPRGDYLPVVVHDGVAHVAGQLSREGEHVIRGPVDAATSREDLTRAARACVLRALSALDHALGTLDTVDKVLFLRGFVHAVPAFEGHSAVLDEACGLLRDVFGDRGRPARSAVGVAGLPSRGLLEIELTVALRAT